MKKLIVFMLTAVLLCGSFALSEEAALTRDEIHVFTASILRQALQQEVPAPEEDEQGGYRFAFDGFAVITEGNTLAADSRLLGAELTGADLPGLRGIAPGSSLKDLLDAFPLDDPSLTGAYDEAVLYIRGNLPGTLQAGRLQRDGSRVSQVEYDVYTGDAGTVGLSCLRFGVEQDTVVSLRADIDIALSAVEADSEADRLSGLQEDFSYTPYRQTEPTPLAREDLLFGPVDFVAADADSLTALLGIPVADTWEEGEGGLLHTMEWEGLQVVLRCDSRQDAGTLGLLSLYGGYPEGPRGIRVDDPMEAVLSRLPAGDGALLYGDGQQMPYGVVDEGIEGPCIRLGVPVEDGQVLLTLEFADGLLWMINCELL